jgi:hypothetical protein
LRREPLAENSHRFLSQFVITDEDSALAAKFGETPECGLLLANWSRHVYFFVLLNVDWEWNVLELRLSNLFRHQFVVNFWDALAIESRQGVADFALFCLFDFDGCGRFLVKKVESMFCLLNQIQISIVNLSFATQDPEVVIHVALLLALQ